MSAFWNKYNYKTGTHCAYCGVRFTETLKRTKDHIMPLCKGGPNHISNYIASCKRCNKVKEGMTLFAYASKMEAEKKYWIANRIMRVYNKCGRMLHIKYPVPGKIYRIHENISARRQ